MKKRKISFIIPIHNEENILEENLGLLLEFSKSNSIDPEILLCENGSTDRTKEIMKMIDSPQVKNIYMKKRGLGAAYKRGILSATAPIAYFTGIDFPFGLENIIDSLAQIEGHDIIFSSKAHPDSIIEVSFKRRVASEIYRALLGIFLGLKIKDPQGCVLFRTDAIKRIVGKCDSESAFFETQIAIQTQAYGLKYTEIPVKYLSPRKGSKFSIVVDGLEMAKNVVKERYSSTVEVDIDE